MSPVRSVSDSAGVYLLLSLIDVLYPRRSIEEHPACLWLDSCVVAPWFAACDAFKFVQSLMCYIFD